MIRKKLYALMAVILMTVTGTYIFSYAIQQRIEKRITINTIHTINNTVGKLTVQRINYMLEILSKEISGKDIKQQRIIINRMMGTFKKFDLDNYTQSITENDGTPIYLTSTETPDINADIQNKSYREFTAKVYNLKKTGGGFSLYSTGKSILPDRIIYVTQIPNTNLWHHIDIELAGFIKTIISMFNPINEMGIIHRRTMNIIITTVFIFILFITIHITKQIAVLEKERDEQNKKLKESNMLLEAEVGIRKQIENDLKEANRELKLIASKDGLTGLANRRYYEEYISTEWERMAREKKPLSIVLCDVDYFKKYNDAYGHLDGDACLRSIADVINDSCKRPADLAARYGGEEFIIILPDTDAAGARIVAENIRSGVEKLLIEHTESKLGYITISGGIAACSPVHGENYDTLIHTADRALYMAKDSGRNKICGI